MKPILAVRQLSPKLDHWCDQFACEPISYKPVISLLYRRFAVHFPKKREAEQEASS